MRKKIEKSDTRLPNTFRQTEPDIRAYTVDDMVADVYSHIIDEDRRYNAQKFEEQFYNAKGLKNAEEGKTAPMPKFETSVELLDPMAEVQKESEVEEEKPAENSTDENAALLAKLLSNPETAALLKALAKTI